MNTQSPPTLYLRTDGSLMLARADGTTIELRLTPDQLIQLGFDALQVAVQLKPECMAEVAHAFEHTTVQVPVDPSEAVPCQRLN